MEKRAVSKTELLHLGVVQQAVELALFSAYVKNEKPVSLLIVADPESGKTQLMKKYAHNKGISAYDECTTYTLIEQERVRMEKGILKHVMIYDMQDVMSGKKYYLSQSLRSMMKSLMEDGLDKWAKYGQDIYFKKRINVGFICGSTLSHVKDKRLSWVKDGFASRFVPFSYEYPIDVIKDIFQSIVDGDYISQYKAKISLDFPKKLVKVGISKKYANILRDTSEELSERYDMRGFRTLKSFIRLAKASAVREEKRNVTATDVNRVIEISRYCNYEGNMIEVKKKKKRLRRRLR